MEENIYPTELEIEKSLCDGVSKSIITDTSLDARNAIHIKISINSNEYPIKDIKNALTEVFHKVIQYYHE